jgi:hypothetical protein
MTLSTCSGDASNNVFKLRGGAPQTFTASETVKVYVCKAANVLQKLYQEFTADQTVNITTITAVDISSASVNPGSFLRILPGTGTIRDLFFEVDKLVSDPSSNNLIKTQMKNIILQNVKTIPTTAKPAPAPAVPTDFDTSGNFKGIYGLINAINLLKSKINTTLVEKSQSGASSGRDFTIDSESAQRLNYITTFYDKKDTKDTLEEISSRENEIYREKFLYIILMIVGVISVGRQLTQRYFSNVDFMGSGGLFSGFSIGRLFNRDSSSLSGLFSNNAYSLKSR